MDTDLTDQDVCESTIGNEAGAGFGASLNPISAFVHDSATAVIFLVGSKATKKWLFLKRTFLPFIANEIFGSISDKEHDGSVNEDYRAEVTVSSFEIQDEVVTDLLRPASRGLLVSLVNPEQGVSIPGLHKEICSDELSMRKFLLEACENRASHTLPPGGSIDTSSAVWEISLTQIESIGERGSGETRTCRSRLMIVDVPSVDSLVNAPKDSVLLSGPNLHKSLVTFVDVVRKLSSPSRAALAPFRSSKLTHYLSESLGGNAIVVGLGMLAHNEPLNSRSTLAIMGALSKAVHYPISSKEFTEVLQGLLCKYRSLILQLEDEIDNGAPIGASASPAVITEKLVNNLQAELSKATLDKNTALQDTARLYEMMELLKAKYKTLLEQKNQQAMDLIRSEEEKMTISRALVELKLQHSQMQEQFEKEKYELTTSAMHNKNDLYDLDAQLLLSRTEVSSIKETTKELEKNILDYQNALAAAKATIAELRDQQTLMNERNVELSGELLTLINQKENLSAKCKDLQNKRDQDALLLDTLKMQVRDNETVANDLKIIIRDTEEKLLAARKAQGESELELKSLRLDIDHNSLNYERSAADFLRSKDEAYNKLKRTTELDIQSLEKQKDELRLQLHKSDRRARDLEKSNQRCRDDLLLVEKEKNICEQDLDALRQVYRSSLVNALTDVNNTDNPDDMLKKPKTPAFEKKLREQLTAIDNGKTPRQLQLMQPQQDEQQRQQKFRTVLSEDMDMQRLITSYSEVEEKSAAEIVKLKRLLHTFKTNYRLLYDRYKTSIDYIEDKLPPALAASAKLRQQQQQQQEDATGDVPTDKGIDKSNSNDNGVVLLDYGVEEATLVQMLKDLEDSSAFIEQDDKMFILSELHKDGGQELADGLGFDPTAVSDAFSDDPHSDFAMNKKVRKAMNNLVLEQERGAAIVKAYKRHLEKAEETIADQKNEIMKLNVNIKQLVDTSEEWKVQAAHQYKEKLKKYIAELKEEKARELKEQAERLKNQYGIDSSEEEGEGEEGEGGYSEPAAAGSRPSSDYDPKGGARGGSNSLYMSTDRGNTSGQSSRSSLLDMSPSPNKRKGRKGGAGGTPAKSSLQDNRPAGHMAKDLMQKLTSVEEENVKISARNMALDEELRNYKIYMRENISMYKKQVIELKMKLAGLAQQLEHAQAQGFKVGEQQQQQQQLLPSILKQQLESPSALAERQLALESLIQQQQQQSHKTGSRPGSRGAGGASGSQPEKYSTPIGDDNSISTENNSNRLPHIEKLY